MTIGLEDGASLPRTTTHTTTHTSTRATTHGTRAVAPAIDVAAERARTAGVTERHYLNAAGAGLMSDAVLERTIRHLRLEQRIGGYAAATELADEVEAVYASAAALLGADADEIACFDTATSGLRAIFDALRLGPGDTVIAPRSSYVSQALRMLALRRHAGVRLDVVPNDATGAMDLTALDRALDQATGRVVVSAVHVPTSSGLVEPVAAIGALARDRGALTVLDATQSVGQIDVDVRQIACDALVTTGRKFLRGPRGTALAYLRRGVLDGLGGWAPDVRGSAWTGADEWTTDGTARQLETWEAAVATRLGLGVAIREALDRGMAATEVHLARLGDRLRRALAATDGVTLADPPAARSAIVTFTVAGLPGKQVVRRLAEARIDAIAVPAAHAQWDLGARGLESVVRVSPHVYNDEADLEALVGRVAEIASGAGAR